MADFGKQLADLMLGPKPEEKPSALPAIPAQQSSVPITGEIKPYDPTFREIASSKLQRGMEALGMNRYKARQRAETLMGGDSSNLPLGMGLADIVPFLGTAMQTQEAARGLEAAGQAAKQGDYIGAGVEGVFGALGMIPGAKGTASTTKALVQKARTPSIQGKIEDRSIPAPFKAQESTVPAAPVAPVKPQGVTYETTQEGPFYRVRPNLPQATGRQNRGTKEGVGRPQGLLGPTGSDVPQSVTDEAVQQMMKQPDNFVRQVADEYSRKNAGGAYKLPEIPESSLLKQAPIGRVFGLAATDDPAYKTAVFDAYAKKYPTLVEKSGAQNYDQLMEASYRQLAKETEQQFRSLPINMSYHRAGEGNYDNSKELLRDIYGNRHMYVYQGGDPHDFLNAVDPSTGLNTNEMFRAVHDFFGHAIHGNQFGPKGEEIAWAAHSKMFSPLARLAMTSETRGQNSFVNYTPLNAELKARINELNGQAYEARRRGQTAMLDEINKDLAEAWQQFQFAPQKSVILPPEFLDLNYKGGMPASVQSLIKPEAGTTTASQLTHFSTRPDLSVTDPRMYGTGIKGEEMARLKDTPGAVTERSYFYAGEPGTVTPEPGLGPYRYGAKSEGLYDVAADPLKLRTLAAESSRIPYTALANKGLVAGNPFTDVERLVKEYGYEGLLNPNLTKPTAIMFKPTPVQPYAKGGKVRISDNLDTMQLELAAGGALKEKIKAKAKEALEPLMPAAKRDENLGRFMKKSVAVDESGKPLRVYHGTSQFDDYADEAGQAFRQFAGRPNWFGVEPYTAEGYTGKGGTIYPSYLSIKKPLNLTFDANDDLDVAIPIAKRLGVDVGHVMTMSNPKKAWELVNSPSFVDAVEKAGYDSIVMNEGGYKTFGVLDPRQIKSATGNRGTFNRKDPDITKAAGGHVSPDPMGDELKSLLGMAGGGGNIKEKLKEKIKEAVKPAFTQKQLESTAEKMADKIKTENPKLSDAEALKKGMRQAEQKLKWEKVEKPALEKTYGALEKAKFSASLPQRQRNVPEVVEKRIQETRDFLAQPVEPWQPPRKELQAFDRERIKEALEGFPGIEQTRFPRYKPARADLSHIEEIYEDPVNRELIKGQITRGLPLGGETFYASLYPLKLAALERGIPEEKFNLFVHSVAPASARNSIMNEMAVGQFLRDMRARGLPLDEETVTREMAKFRDQYGIGLPLMPVHREGVKNVLEGNQDLRELLKADIPTNYKIPTYGTQKAGDFGQSVVLDVHEAAGQTRGSRFHPYFTEQGGFGATEYGAAEGKMLDIAGELGVPGGMAQAGRWFGGGELTGLKSPRGDALDLLERQTAYTLKGLGINPTPRNVRNYILDMIDTGEGVLMPWFKKEGMPDVRTEKKKGGAVKKKRKVKISDNKDAQMLASLIR